MAVAGKAIFGESTALITEFLAPRHASRLSWHNIKRPVIALPAPVQQPGAAAAR